MSSLQPLTAEPRSFRHLSEEDLAKRIHLIGLATEVVSDQNASPTVAEAPSKPTLNLAEIPEHLF